MNIIWSPEAIGDLIAVRSFISREDPTAAQRVVLAIFSRVEALLPAAPEMGRAGRVPGTRELVIPGTPFVVPYRLRDNEIHILRVYHGARRWPESL